MTKHRSWFLSPGIPRLELENPHWNSYVGHWNSYVRIPMSNIGIPMWVFQLQPWKSEGGEQTIEGEELYEYEVAKNGFWPLN